MPTPLLALLLLASLAVHAQWTPEDVVNAEAATAFNLSPDGKTVAWTKRTANKEKDAFVTKLFLTRLDQKEGDGPASKFVTVQLTRGEESDRSPIFARDGKLIYFTSTRDKGKKLWGINPAGGEAYEIKSFENTVSNLQWLNDSTLAFVAEEGKSLYEKEAEERKDDVQVIEDTAHFKPSRLFAFNVKTKEVRRLTDNRFPLSGYAVSRDGAWVVSTHTRSPHYGADGQPRPEIRLWNLAKGTQSRILGSMLSPGSFVFTQDGSGFYFSTNQTSDTLWNGAGVSKLHFYTLGSGNVTPVPLGWEWGLAGGPRLAVGNHLLVELANGPTNKLVLVEKVSGGDPSGGVPSGGADRWTVKPVGITATMNEHVTPIILARDANTLLFSHSTASTPTQYYAAKLLTDAKKATVSVASETPLFSLNEGFKKKKIAKTEVIRWKGWNDEDVTGILYYPTAYQPGGAPPGRAYPLVVAIHGGPSAYDGDDWSESWAYYPNIMAQKGAFVLLPNYHGSSNHGQAFVESIAKNYYDPEMDDITKGVETLIAKGLVHRDSMGVQGWSNGAILATMLTVRYPNMFKVAAPGAGDVNWTSDFGTCQFGVTFDQHYFGGAPWDNVGGKIYNEVYITKSPLFELERVRTPTIIFHGSEDRQVPRDQGWEYYRALQQIGKAPVRFLWFPGQPHGLQKVTHQLRKMKEEIAWFDKYLFGKRDTLNEAFKKESPLAMLLEREKVPKTAFGFVGLELPGGLTLPSVVSVKKDSIAFGQFEVTQAQLLSQKNGTKAEPTNSREESNFPATNITFEQAQAYCQWLSEKTGQKYRLPNAREAKVLHEKAKTADVHENTLNYWAGYAPTLDEVPLLRQKIAEAKTSLLKSVGSFKAVKVGEADLYDLGGNVAEWYTKDDGTPGTYGFSAYDLADATADWPRNQHSQTSTGYIGFRVVRER
ncbi:MAG: prolyl oligopeptidase family serine peptidase [Cytophagaceae bacterium]|nr:prolyl oligopeptidase family serine peptidase [Cytophagaceae bacterium]